MRFCDPVWRRASGKWRRALALRSPANRSPEGLRHILILCLVVTSGTVFAQSSRYHLGRSPTPDEIKAWDIAVGPDGRELPPGRGTVARGKVVYVEQCARCHGATAVEGPEMPLAGGAGTLNTAKPLKTIGSYWPYATTLFDYINRAMPFDRPTVMSPADVYAVTGFLLNLNGIVGDEAVMDGKTLPAVRMPNRDGFIPDQRPDIGHRKGKGGA